MADNAVWIAADRLRREAQSILLQEIQEAMIEVIDIRRSEFTAEHRRAAVVALRIAALAERVDNADARQAVGQFAAIAAEDGVQEAQVRQALADANAAIGPTLR